MIKATIHEAKTHLSKLIMEVESGEEVVLYRDKEPVARLVGLRRTDKKRPPSRRHHVETGTLFRRLFHAVDR
jgi:antitoxin (DNA-binding transcriptional repressor) of toxin-antitoxin stability system